MINKIIKYFFLAVLFCCVFCIYYVCATTEGLKFTIHYLESYLPGKITIGKIDGALFSEFSLQDIVYEYQGQQASIKSFTVKWIPAELLKGQLALDGLQIKEAHIQLSDQVAGNDSKTDSTSLKSVSHYLNHIQVKHLILENLTLQKGQQTIFVNGTLNQNWNLSWKIALPKINDLIADTSGSFQGQGNISGPRLTPTIDATININKLFYAQQKIDSLAANLHVIVQPGAMSTLRLRAVNLNIYDYTFKHFNLNADGNITRQRKALILSLNLITDDQTKIAGMLTLPKFLGFTLNQPIDGEINFSVKDLSLLTQIISDIKNPQGLLQGTIALSGTLKNPQHQTTLNITNGRFDLPILGITLNNINLHGSMDNQLNLAFNGQFQSDGSTATLQGNCDLANPNYPLSLKLQGNNLLTINLKEYKVFTSPDINLLLEYPNLRIQGNLTIPRAEVNPKNVSSVVTLPEETIFVHKTQPAIETSPMMMTLLLNVALGDAVNINYNNLKANLAGNLRISMQPGSPAQGSGELYTTRGNYTAYGKSLTIDTGRLIYTGNALTNPGLDIRAVKQIRHVATTTQSGFMNNNQVQTVSVDTETLTVGVQVQGTAQNPRISLYSVPSGLSQADILSYLLLGVPQSQASGSQGSALLTALSAYNPDSNRVLGLTSHLQESLGLNELNVESVESFDPNKQAVVSTTSFVVGKQITKKLSIHYSIGLFNPVSILNLRYQLSTHWAVQSETSSLDNGADILYGFERD